LLTHQTVLPNGLRVLATEMSQARSITIALFVGVGSRLESSEQSGVSHFTEHMLFKGTERRPTSREVSETIEAVGGVLNAETSKELTVYWVKVAQAHWQLAIDLLADLVLHSRFSPDEVERERKVILEELSMIQDEPGDWVHVLIDELLWDGSPLAWDVAGRPETVRGITREDLLRHVSQHYRPDNAAVSVAGPVPETELVAEIERQFGGWNGTALGARTPTSGSPAQARLRIEEKRGTQEHICIAVPGIALADPDRYPLDLFSIVLGEGMSSRLFLELRDRRGLAYDVHSYVNYYRDAGSVVVYVGVEPEQAETAVAAIVEQIAKLKADLSASELSKAKEYWKGRLELSMEDTHSVATWAGAQQMLLGHVYTVEEVMDCVDRVTIEDVRRVAGRLFTPESLRLAAVGPLRKGERLSRWLRL